jgi:hypothetical protein
LVLAFVDTAGRKNATNAYLTAGARDSDPVHAICRRLKFRLARAFEAPGRRLMNEYVLYLQAQDEAHPQGNLA